MSDPKIAPAHNPILKKSPLFADLSELELNAAAAFLEPRRIGGGEIIFDEGAAGEELYILVSGKIGAWVSRPDGSRHWMFEIMPGDFFGEMSVIANRSRTATLTARTDSELLVFHGIDFFRIIYEHPIIGMKMLKAIRKVQNSWLEQTSKDLNDLMRWGETASRRAVTDELTDLYNRRFLEESALSRFEQGSVGPRNISLLVMDLDNFHKINSTHGPKVGDKVFVVVADVLRASTRAEDICARFSGDEFAVLLPDAGPDDALVIAERIRKGIASKRILVPGTGSAKTEIALRTSIGIASAPAHADNWETLFSKGDQALKKAKDLGRNRVELAQ